MKKQLLAVLLAVLVSIASVSAQGPAGGPNGQRGGNRGGNGGGADKSSDAELQKMITEIIPQFELVTREDPETGITLQYQLFIPADYDANEKYPLVQFIPDSSVVGKGSDAVLTQGWGGLIWASRILSWMTISIILNR